MNDVPEWIDQKVVHVLGSRAYKDRYIKQDARDDGLHILSLSENELISSRIITESLKKDLLRIYKIRWHD